MSEGCPWPCPGICFGVGGISGLMSNHDKGSGRGHVFFCFFLLHFIYPG